MRRSQSDSNPDKGTYTYEKRDPATGAWVSEAPVAYDKATGTKVFVAMMERFNQDTGERRVLERHTDKFGKVRPRIVADSTEGRLSSVPALSLVADSDEMLFAF